MGNILNLFKRNWVIILLMIAAFLLSSWPSFVFKLPITQTDGVFHYVSAKTYAETGTLNADIPKYGLSSALETNINQQPPFVVLSLGMLLKYFGNDFFFINGFYCSIFFVIAILFIYLFTKDMFGKNVALLSSSFSILNIRAYYTSFVGLYPAFVSFCLSFPSIYFTYLYIKNKRINYFVLGIFFNALVCLTYIQQAFFVIIIELFMLFGFLLHNRFKFKLNFKLDLHRPSNKYEHHKRKINTAIYYLLLMIMFLFVIFNYVFTVKAREYFINQLITAWFNPYYGYQAVWANFL